MKRQLDIPRPCYPDRPSTPRIGEMTLRACAKGLVALVTLAWAAGCGSVDPNVEDLVTIETGVYGQLVRGCDTPDCAESYIPEGRLVGVFGTDPMLDSAAVPVAMTSVRERGFYEIELGAGQHWILIDALDGPGIDRGMTPAQTTLATDVRERWDWTSDRGGGLWSN